MNKAISLLFIVIVMILFTSCKSQEPNSIIDDNSNEYYDFWHNNTFYLGSGYTNYLYILEMETLTEQYIELPYDRSAILEIVDDITIRLVTDANSIEKSSYSDF